MKQFLMILLAAAVVFANDAADAAFKAGDYKTASKILSKEAKNGNINSQYNLALMYYNGFGVDQNLTKALELLESAAKAGHTQAIENIGRIYMQVINFDKAAEWLKVNAANGDTTAYYLLAEIYAEKENFKEAKKWAKKAIDAGNNEALLLWQQYNLEKY